MGQRFLIAVAVTLSLLVSDLLANRPAPKAAPAPAPRATPHPVAPHPSVPHPNASHMGAAHPGAVHPGSTQKGGAHPNVKGPQRTNAVLKAAILTHSSKVEQHLHNSAHWHHAWVWGVYSVLPTNASNMVVGVPSGNALRVTTATGGTQRVRLAGVGAPVVGQALFSESQGNLEALANGQHVRVFPVGTDFDGAVVAQVFLDSGLYLNERQIQSGMAWNAVDDGFDPSLAGAEEVAQSGGAGMWGGDYSAAF